MGLSYADAVQLMGGRESRIVGALDRLTGGFLLAASAAGAGFALTLFEAKGELARLSGELVRGLGERVRGLDRLGRTERLAAAHSVVTVAAYFEVLAGLDLPFDLKELELTKAEQVTLAGGEAPGSGRLRALAVALLRADVPMPAPQLPYEMTLRAIRVFYQDLSAELAGFVSGLAVWDRVDGSGKSVLTQVLAARLPPGDFLVVRVLLREVAADADLQFQIEHAIRSATGEALAWPDLSRSADGALPVVLIDGFDELLQATAVRQADYLRKAADFQAREATQGRPVAVLVTSRTAVADRAQPAPGMTVIRLEPFSTAQITQWLSVWNDANAGGLAARGLRTLPPQTAVEHADLASQPLLLLMLALYDADGNRLQHAATVLDEAGLYERLLTSFAEREIGKSGADLPGGQFREAVERELLRLSVVALAMFTRSRQWVSEAELDADLAALLGSPDGQPAPSGLRAPLSAAQMMVGRFFFIHEARATRDNTRLSTYEFLHATFGEFLIARLVARELCDLADTVRLAAGRTRPEPADDAFLHALLSYMPLTMRGTIMSFLTELFRGLPGTQRQRLCTMLLGLFRDSLMPRQSTRYGDYAPLPLPVPARHAAYSANLAVLAVLTAGELAVSRLFPGARDPVSDWRFSAELWRSQLPYEGWEGLITGTAIDRIWDNGERDIILRPGDIARTGRRPVRITDPRWFQPDWDGPGHQPLGPGDFSIYLANASRFQDQVWFLCDDTDDSLAHALDPLAPDLTTAITAFHGYGSDPDHVVSAAHALISLWVASSKDSSQDELARAYETCMNIVIHGFAPNQAEARELFRTMVLRQLAVDRPRLPQTWLDSAVLRIRDAGRANDREGHALLKIAGETLLELMTPDHQQDLAIPPREAES